MILDLLEVYGYMTVAIILPMILLFIVYKFFDWLAG